MKSENGSILIITLWVLSFLTIFAIGLGNSVSIELRLATHLQDRLKMYYLAKAGVEKAIIKLTEDDESILYDTLNEPWGNNEEFFSEMPLDSGYVSVSYKKDTSLYGLEDESGKININKVPVQVLKTLLENVGEAETEEAGNIANSIVDWRDTDIIISPGGAEDGYYKGLKIPYPCKDNKFQVPEELLLVKGMTPEIYERFAGVITVYGEKGVNLNTADSLTLHALGLSSELAERIIEFRRGKDEIDGTEDDNIFKTVGDIRNIGPLFTEEAVEINRLTSLGVLTVKSDFFRITSHGILKKGEMNLQRNIVSIVRRQEKEKPEMLYWREQ